MCDNPQQFHDELGSKIVGLVDEYQKMVDWIMSKENGACDSKRTAALIGCLRGATALDELAKLNAQLKDGVAVIPIDPPISFPEIPQNGEELQKLIARLNHERLN